MDTHYSVIIVGGGQAGLAISYLLKQQNIQHLIFEKNTIGHAWRNQRWDSFCLVTPNWQCQLPGFPYAAGDDQGFMEKEKIVEYLESYAASFQPPIREGVAVNRLTRRDNRFELTTTAGDFSADQVIIATGGYHTPKIPAIATQFPEHIIQLHSVNYKNPESLPDNVLVVGTGQSGCQIAEDLHLAGKTVHLATGSAPRAPRRYRGKDVVEWLDLMGYYDLPIDEHPQKETVRHKTNHYLTGRDGGRDIDLRKFALEGMYLYGRLDTIDHEQITFVDNLAENLDQADGTVARLKKNIDAYITEHQLSAPTEKPYEPLWEPENPPLTLETKAIDVVIWSTGFNFNYDWVDLPVFDGAGEPIHDRGVTDLDGLYFIGLPWLYTWGSGRFSGVARDAEYLADKISARIPTPSM
ncbi:MAG: MSMEG_0569 family flavin-dependent oxidoreductase [Limnothrix sp. RL_2_0]|nr:MSMEG_0569 family flavin-dependent oxidoreductase [Limnothrix sp. RL_2_0]